MGYRERVEEAQIPPENWGGGGGSKGTQNGGTVGLTLDAEFVRIL